MGESSQTQRDAITPSCDRQTVHEMGRLVGWFALSLHAATVRRQFVGAIFHRGVGNLYERGRATEVGSRETGTLA